MNNLYRIGKSLLECTIALTLRSLFLGCAVTWAVNRLPLLPHRLNAIDVSGGLFVVLGAQACILLLVDLYQDSQNMAPMPEDLEEWERDDSEDDDTAGPQ